MHPTRPPEGSAATTIAAHRTVSQPPIVDIISRWSILGLVVSNMMALWGSISYMHISLRAQQRRSSYRTRL